MDVPLLLVWLVMWFGVMGFSNYLFAIGKTTYYQQPFLNSLGFLIGCGALVGIYKEYLTNYFTPVSSWHLVMFGIVTISWFIVPKLYHNDHYLVQERLGYQTTKWCEIIFQQLAFLAGLLTLGQAWYWFGLLFFLVHFPVPLFIPKGFGVFLVLLSLPGGLIFAYLHALGVGGFMLAVAVHFAFYAVLPLVLGSKLFPDISVIRR